MIQVVLGLSYISLLHLKVGLLSTRVAIENTNEAYVNLDRFLTIVEECEEYVLCMYV